jgi:hypothetical protein
MYYATGMPGWGGYGWGTVPVPPAPGQEAQVLRSEAERLKAALDEVRARLDELEGTDTE